MHLCSDRGLLKFPFQFKISKFPLKNEGNHKWIRQQKLSAPERRLEGLVVFALMVWALACVAWELYVMHRTDETPFPRHQREWNSPGSSEYLCLMSLITRLSRTHHRGLQRAKSLQRWRLVKHPSLPLSTLSYELLRWAVYGRAVFFFWHCTHKVHRLLTRPRCARTQCKTWSCLNQDLSISAVTEVAKTSDRSVWKDYVHDAKPAYAQR